MCVQYVIVSLHLQVSSRY